MHSAYRYRAIRADGTLENGLIEHAGRTEAVGLLRSRGLLPLSVEPSNRGRPHRHRLRPADLAVGLRTLAALLGSGLSLSRALAAFEESAPIGWRVSIPGVRERIREGDGFGTALERSRTGVPSLMIGVIKAGEGGSGLVSAVARAAELAEGSARLRASIRSALTYPLLLAVVGAASIAIIVGVVLPRFVGIIAGIGGSVPRLARGIIAIGLFARSAALPAVIALAAAIALWKLWINEPAWRIRVHRALLTIPVVGPLRLMVATSRLCAALSALLDAGVPVALALYHSAAAAGDAEVERRVLETREQVIGGARLSTALSSNRAVTPTAVRLVHAGEESGQLPQMLERAAALDSAQLESALHQLVRIIEPLMIIAFAGMIAIVCGALLQTVYAVKP